MNILVNILIFFLVIIEYLSFFYVIYGKRRQDKQYENKLFIIIINIACLVCIVWLGKTEITLVLALVMSVINLSLIYHLLWLETVSLYFLAFLMLSILESVTGYFLKYLLHLDNAVLSLTYLTIIIALLWVFYFLLGRKIERDAFILEAGMNIILSLFLLIIIAMLSYFTYALSEVINTRQGLFGLGLVTFGGGIILVTFLLMIYYFNVQQKYQIKNEVLEKYNEQQKKYFELLLEKEQKTRQFRHDIIAELIQIKNLSIKRDYDGLEKYIAETLKEISFISKYDYDVGNDTVNTLLNYYLLPVRRRCKIEINGYFSDSVNVSDRDLCIVISNLILNAIEAVDKVVNYEKKISFTIKVGKIFTYFIIKNTYQNTEDKIIQNEILTTKSDKRNHGYGLKNVKNIVEKNSGELVLKVEKNQFIVELRIRN
ncbi:MAG: GHKL domain-containing protein [Lachnospiraceae bacterium]|nr:GHKL domain-containing protein [Lachnospiraceae bacterium]